MKKIVILVIAIFLSYGVSQAETGSTIRTMIQKQIGVPVQLKNQKLNETVNVEFKLEKGKATVVDIKTSNQELKNYIMEQFKTIKFDNSSEKEGITYFVDINFRVL